MYVLLLNNMQSSQVEIMTPIARAETKEELVALIEREKVDCYTDGKWRKSYRAGGPLEWYNPPTFDHESFLDVGTAELHAKRARANFDREVIPIPLVENL